jgi:signal peptidase I
MQRVKNLWKKETVKIIIAATMILAVVLGFFFIMQLALNTQTPFLISKSDSMCLSENVNCEGWIHPFSQTLHIGDLLVIQGVNPTELNSDYPNSDIIAFRNQANGDLIVHRIVSEQTIDGTTYFRTKGDANGPTLWPNFPSYFDDIPSPLGVPQDEVVGRVVLRVPWIGGITLFLMNNPWSLAIIGGLIALMIIARFVNTTIEKKRKLIKYIDQV